MKKQTLTIVISGIFILMSSGLFAQLGTRQARPTNFFTQHKDIQFIAESLGGRENGHVVSAEVKGNKIILDVFIKGEPNPNMPPHMQPQDRNIEKIVYFENGEYYAFDWEDNKVIAELNDADDQIILNFLFMEHYERFYVNK